MGDTKKPQRWKEPMKWLRTEDIASPEKQEEAMRRHYGATRIRLIPNREKAETTETEPKHPHPDKE